MRRSVRSPVCRLTTSAISSSVCRLPFISAAASEAHQFDGAKGGGVAVRHVFDAYRR
jgi:hypothetical protein